MKDRNPNDGEGTAPFGVTDQPTSGNGGMLHGSARNDSFDSQAGDGQPWSSRFHAQSSDNADELAAGENDAAAEPFAADGRPQPDSAAKLAIVDAVTEGDAHRQAKNWLAARDAYTRALLVDNTLQPIWLQLGHATKQSGDTLGA